MGKKFFFRLFMLLLEGEEKECLPKFGVLIFILAHEIKSLLSKLEALFENIEECINDIERGIK